MNRGGNFNTNTVTSVNVVVDKDRVCQRLGYKERSPSALVTSLVDSQIEKAHKLIKPAYTYELKAIGHIFNEEVSLGDSLVFSSKTISYVLSDCKWGAIYVATIGEGLEGEATRLMKKGEMLEATVLDAIGSTAVLQVRLELQDTINGIAKAKGYQTIVRFSPGYCDWHVSQQKILCQSIDADLIGVRLTESCMMIPIKSISGVIGIGRLDPTKPPPCVTICKKRASCEHKSESWDPEKQWIW